MSADTTDREGYIIWNGRVLTGRYCNNHLQYRRVEMAGTKAACVVWRHVPHSAAVSILYETAAEANDALAAGTVKARP